VVRIVSGGEDAGWADWVSWLVSIPPGSGGCHRVYPKRVEGATLFEHSPPNPFKIRVGSDPINRLTHRW